MTPELADRDHVARTLLLADDSLAIQRVIELTFAGEDVDVVSVSDGEQAIARVSSNPPDIVLADVGMPGKNGYDVASFIKHSPQFAHIPVLLLTGAFEPVDQRKAAEAGCDGVLAKPFEPQLVIGRVKELLERPRDEQSPKAPAPPTPWVSPTFESDGLGGGDDAASSSLDDFFDQLDAAIANLPGPGRDERPASPTEVGGAPRSPQSPPQAIPALAEAFAALLAAEQGASPLPEVAWPQGNAIGDELVDRVAARVLERLSDRVVRETVTDLVSSTAERLVREEIERLKASIK